jgi:hypothetical protein
MHEQKMLSKAKIVILFTSSSCLLPSDSAGDNARELWWTSQELSFVEIIPPWFSVLIYHLGDEQ